MRKKLNEGITLVALVITVIIMIILVGVSINVFLSEDGLINKARSGASKYQDEAIKESINLAVLTASSNIEAKIDENILKEQLDKQLGEGKYTYTINTETGEVVVTYNEKEYKISANGVSSTVEDDEDETGLTNLEISESTENINTSAKVSAINGRKVTINEETLKTSELTGGFEVNNKVMLYVSNTDSNTLAGKYETYRIASISENEITLDGNIDGVIFTSSNCQLVKIAKYGQVKIDSGVVVTPSAYDGNSGGIVAIEANEIILNGKIDASKKGYTSSYTAPNNGGTKTSGNQSWAGGSNKYKGGNGGTNYQGNTGIAPDPICISNNLREKRMTFGGGSNSNTCGGGVIYIGTVNLEIGSQYALSANGQGSSSGVYSGGGAGGTICLNAKNIIFNVEDKNYFVGANAGSGGSQGYISQQEWPAYNGTDGTNIKGGDAPANNNGKTGGVGFLSNGGGGAQTGYNGEDATASHGGNGIGAGSGWTGYDAGSGGGGRRIC